MYIFTKFKQPSIIKLVGIIKLVYKWKQIDNFRLVEGVSALNIQRKHTNSICIPITFNSPFKASFSNK